jgi:hypothetical protein
MGSLILPSSGPVYADALIFIYSVEKHPIYALTLRPLWEAVARGDLEVLSSELTLMETLIGPLKQGDAAFEMDYENFFASPGIRLLPITSSILRAGARLRATLNAEIRRLLAELHHSRAARIRVAGGGAGGDAPDAQASALGLPYGQSQPPERLAHHGIQRITVEFSEKSPTATHDTSDPGTQTTW